MAERIERLQMRAFRGVPDELTIDLADGRSLLVFGDNATGKSTIADAIEWYLTGRIDYLSKENRGQGLRNAACRPNLETSVTVQTTGELGGRVTQDAEPPAEVVAAARREYCLLRGRDLSRFVEKTKAEKWGALSGILGLEPAEQLRADLYTARTNLRNAHKDAEDDLGKRADAIRTSGVARADEKSILDTAVDLCKRAGTESPESLAQAIDEEWLDERLSGGGATERHGSLRALHDELAATEPVADTERVRRWNEFVASGDTAAKSRIGMLNNAREFVDREDVDDCPLCGQPVDVYALSERIRNTLDGLREASLRLDDAREHIGALFGRIERIIDRLKDLRARGADLDVELDELPPSPLTDVCERVKALEAIDPDVLADYARSLSSWLDTAVEVVDQAAPQLPEGRDATFSELTRLAMLARQWGAQRREVATTYRAKELAERIYGAYADEQRRHMTAVLNRISKRVADIYASLHPQEGLDAVALETIGEKGVELTVEFHGEQHRPPQRVLSESHMNSLGLALFLAMHDTYNERLGFLVLDDVVNSFDIEHRGAFAELLATEYDDQQLIVLTHDHQFYTRLARKMPAWRHEEFIGWDYEHGPRTRGAGPEPHLSAAHARLDHDDTIGAAQRARRALEEILLDACENLQAPLPFRRGTDNERRDATELLNGLRRALRKYAKSLKSHIEPLLKEIEGDLQAALNVESHAGSGRSANNEIASAIGRIEELRSTWTCRDCQTPVWLIGDPRAGRCRCGASRFPPPGEDDD